MLTAARIRTTIPIIVADVASNLPLLLWLSPAFPVGAFAYSHGFEWAVESGDVHDRASLEAWLADLVAHGSIRADVILLAAAWRAPDAASAVAISELGLALAPTRERWLETSTQGTAFLGAVSAAWPAPALTAFAAALGSEEVAYPVAVGVTAAAHLISLRPTLEAFALAALGNLVSAALRLGPIGQSEAQAILAGLCPAVARLAAFAEATTLDALGSGIFRADIASMRHETQYSRLFRS